MLVINKYPHVIERELPKRIKADILMSAFTAGDDFSYQPDYIKFYFAPYITVLHKKRIPYIDGRYEFGDFEVGVNCVYPIMKFFNIPLNTLDEYALKALINYGYIPKDAIEPDKQSLVESALSYNTYMEVQSELYKLKNSNIISGEELSMYLNNLREKQNELGYNGLVQPEPICEESGISTYEQMVEEKLNKEKLQKIKDKRFMSILLGGLGVLLIIILIIYLLQ